jgi:hypothetical protein
VTKRFILNLPALVKSSTSEFSITDAPTVARIDENPGGETMRFAKLPYYAFIALLSLLGIGTTLRPSVA